MEYIGQKFGLFFEPMALTIILVYLYGMIHRGDSSPGLKQLSMGLIFGFAAAVSMYVPMTIADGIIIDLRNLFIGIAAGFFGWRAGILTLAIAITVRLSIGGIGVVYAIPAMCLVTVMGLIWRRYFWKKGDFKRSSLPVLGAMIAISLLNGFFLPKHLLANYFINVVPALSIMYLLGSYILGCLLQREARFLKQTHHLKVAATTDPLTNLMNRRKLEEVVLSMPKADSKTKGRAILTFDIDNFKDINDTFGHAAGDATLIELCCRTQKCLRPTDVFARMGGDEFVIILPDTNTKEAKIVAERCRNAISRGKFEGDGHVFDVSISVGVKWVATPQSFSAELARADAALYRAKSMGRNCVVYDIETKTEDTPPWDLPASA